MIEKREVMTLFRIIPSLASAKQLNLRAAIDSLGTAGCLHLDMEDGNFISNITFGVKTVGEVADYYCGRLDVHLMVRHPERYLDALFQGNIDSIAIQIEAMPYPLELMKRIRQSGRRAGIALNPSTPVEPLKYLGDKIDYLLIMTAEPDGEGQSFLPAMLEKISKARSIFPKEVSILTDGGILEEHLSVLANAGADGAVLGRTIWNSAEPERKYWELTKKINRN